MVDFDLNLGERDLMGREKKQSESGPVATALGLQLRAVSSHEATQEQLSL